MFKEGQVYKVKVELSPDLMGFGRATVISADSHRIYVQLKSSKGNKLNVPKGTKIWFVGSSSNNRFNGLWSSEVTGSKLINGVAGIECRTPKFQQHLQRRSQSRMDLTAPLTLLDDEWKNLNAKMTTRNISRLGLGFAVEAECADKFPVGKVISMQIRVGNICLDSKARIVNSRFNWLLNRTEIGAEFADLDVTSLESLDRVLVWLGNRPQGMKAQLSESGSLARWVKAGKDNLSLIKAGEADNLDETDIDDDLEELEDIGME